jgi:hypothetical protein
VFAANPLFGTIIAIETVVVAFVVILAVGNVMVIRRALMLMLKRQVAPKTSQHLHAH